MKKFLVVLFAVFSLNWSFAQEMPDSMELVSGSLNVSVQMGRNSGSNTAPETGMYVPGSLVGNIYVGYQYLVGDNWGVNTSLGIGYQPFRFRTTTDASKNVFNETTFMMPYFGLQLELQRIIQNSTFFSISANLHVNTLAKYSATYNNISPNVASFQKLKLERNLTEYAGVQHGVSFAIGKQISSGSWSGIDIYFMATLLNRQKLVIDYYLDANTSGDAVSPDGKVKYNGGFIGIGICYNFKG